MQFALQRFLSVCYCRRKLNCFDAPFKDTLWVLRRDELLVHISVDISLITKHILDHVISLES